MDNADNERQAPKPVAPLDVDAALDRLEQAGASDTASADIDADIAALEAIHTQLTRDLHHARA